MSGANVDDVFNRVELKVLGVLKENETLREQNRVLVGYLKQARDSAKQVHDMAMKNVCPNPDTITMENVAIDHLEFLDRLLRVALTATSQPGGAHEL